MLMDGERQQQQQLQLGQRQRIDGPSIRDGEYAVNHVLVDTKSTDINQCETDNSHVIGSHMTTATTNANTSDAQDVSMVDVKVKIETDVKIKIETEVTDVNMVKKRRGRPPRSQEKAAVPPKQPQQATPEDEEDVCFICLDGGDLVLCDRRGCPKAYHPACIKRDESFFRSKAKWNCGWHICSRCQKTSHYLCYTCTHSLCKRCTKDSDYLCVRENKGFCGVCMKTIMLIENIASGNQEQVKVDFDDKTSWEYFFKVYWISLKEKLSLTVDELTKAKNPWREEPPRTRTYWGRTNSYLKRGSLGQLQYYNADNSSENCGSQVAIHDCKRRKTENQLMDLNINASQMMTEDDQRFKTQMKTDEMRPNINLNVDEDAAIDVHTVRLLYVKRNLMEDLLDDAENFHEKVVGSFVRVKVSGDGQEQDLHRVVQVVGTSKVAQSYRVGARTTDIVLEIQNLNKEVISIDTISDEEFSEEECKHLQESVKCGLIKKLTVGEIVRKARMLQHVKLSDFLEAEISQLKHLPTQAIEMGKQKELRDYMEKLERLKSSHEGQGDHVALRNSLNGRDDTASIHRGEAFDLNDVKRPKNLLGSSLSGASNPNNRESLQQQFSSRAAPRIVLALSAKEQSLRGSETEKIWQYRDPAGKIQGPFSKTQLRTWSDKGLFPLDLRTWSIFEKEEASILLTDALFGQSNKATPRTCNGHLPSLDIAYSSNDSGLSHNKDVAWLNNQKADQNTWTSMRTDANGHFNSSDESLRSNECSHSSSWTPPMDASVTRDEQAQSSLQLLDINKSTKSSVDQSEICGPHPIPASSAKLRKESHQCEKLGFSEIDVNANSPMTVEDSTRVRKGQDKHEKSSSNGPDSSFGMSMAKSTTGKLEQNHAADLPNLPSAAPTHSQKELKGQATVNKKSVSSNALVNDPGPAGSPASSFEAAKALLDLLSDFGGSSVAAAKLSPKEWDTNTVSTSSLKLPEGATDHAPTPTSGNDNLTPSSPTHPPKLPEGVNDHAATPTSGKDYLTLSSPTLPNPDTTLPNFNPNLIPTPSPTPALNLNPDSVPNPDPPHPNPTLPNPPESNPTLPNPNPPPLNPTIDALGWQPILPEPNEFCPLVDESVSDLLAEVEAMESMGGLPSPTSKMTSPGGLMQDSDFFSPLDGFTSASDARRAEILSFTQMLFEFDDEEQIQPSNMHSSESIVTESTGIPQISTQLAITSNPLQESHASSQSAVTEQHGASKMPSNSSLMNKPPEQPHTSLHDYFSRHSSASAMDRDPKPSDSLIRTWKEALEIHPPVSADREKAYSNVQPFTSSPVFPWDPIADVQLPGSATSGTSWGTVKENTNFGQGVRQVNTNVSWGTSGVVQQHTNVDAGNWNPGWANQAREYGNRVSGARDNRNSYHGRETNGGRDRSSWNRQSLHHGSGNGGSYRTPPKGQRVCKFHENGYCKKGAACSFWHP